MGRSMGGGIVLGCSPSLFPDAILNVVESEVCSRPALELGTCPFDIFRGMIVKDASVMTVKVNLRLR